MADAIKDDAKAKMQEFFLETCAKMRDTTPFEKCTHRRETRNYFRDAHPALHTSITKYVQVGMAQVVG